MSVVEASLADDDHNSVPASPASSVATIEPTAKEPKRGRGEALDPAFRCKSTRKDCKQRRMDGYYFCIKHILEDANCPFKQCRQFLQGNTKCTNPIPKSEDRDFCNTHMQALGLAPRTRKRKVEKVTSESTPSSRGSRSALPTPTSEIPGTPSSVCEDAAQETSKPVVVKKQSHEQQRGLDPESRFFLALEANGIDPRKDLGIPEGVPVKGLTIDESDAFELTFAGPESPQGARMCFALELVEDECLRDAGVVTVEETLSRKCSRLKRFRSLLSLQRQILDAHQWLLELGRGDPTMYNPKSTSEANSPRFCRSCNGRALPLSSYCAQHILSDQDQALYRRCPIDGCDCVVVNYQNGICLCHLRTEP